MHTPLQNTKNGTISTPRATTSRGTAILPLRGLKINDIEQLDLKKQLSNRQQSYVTSSQKSGNESGEFKFRFIRRNFESPQVET